MATWQDGPEYAPRERPAAFVVPDVPPLAAPLPATPVEVAPTSQAPAFTPPEGSRPELAALVPAGAPGRNPKVAFEVSAATITTGSWSAGSATGGRLPTEPFASAGPPLTGHLPAPPVVQPSAQVNPAPFPGPNTPQWFAPPPQTRVPAPPPSVTVSQIWNAATAGVMVPLLIGALFNWMSILMLAVSFALSARIPYRRDAIRRSYSLALSLLGLSAAFSLLSDGYSADLMFAALSGSAQFACFVLTIAVGLIVGAALRAGERPDRLG